MRTISFKKEIIYIGTLDEILAAIMDNKNYIHSIDIQEKEPITAYDFTKETQYRAKIVYKRSDTDETKI